MGITLYFECQCAVFVWCLHRIAFALLCSPISCPFPAIFNWRLYNASVLVDLPPSIIVRGTQACGHCLFDSHCRRPLALGDLRLKAPVLDVLALSMLQIIYSSI